MGKGDFMKTGKQVILWALPIIAFGAIVMMAAEREYREGIEDRITAAIELFPLGDDPDGVARLDTSTGEIWMLNSTLHNASVAGEWNYAVAGVGHKDTGSFRVQRAKRTIFLVDVTNGDTWLLRQRGSTPARFTWSYIKEHRSTITASGSSTE